MVEWVTIAADNVYGSLKQAEHLGELLSVEIQASGKSSGQSFEEAQSQWKKVEIEINEALLKRGITGVTVSFIGDTAFLKGEVNTENKRFTAEQAARSVLEVQHIHNGIWVVP